MEVKFNQNIKVGILGAGQLGKMLAQSISPLDAGIRFMDKNENMAAGLVAGDFVRGDITAYADVMAFGNSLDVLGIEIENVNTQALSDLRDLGVKIFPNPDALRIIQDKGLQKNFYKEHGFPSSPYRLYEDKKDIENALEKGEIEIPFVQKARTEGYDGRGVQVIRTSEDMAKVFDVPSVIEELVDIDKEVSVIACRDSEGNIECFPAVEMVFDGEANLVKYLACPADISANHDSELHDMAREIIEQYDIEGLLAIEYFINTSGEILVNEVAPRPHNSGHHTIESISVSQFNQHMRAMLGLPLVHPELVRPAVMVNLLGEYGHEGPVRYQGIEDALSTPGVYIHLYGKNITRPNRKMGHITIANTNLEEAKKISERIDKNVKVIT